MRNTLRGRVVDAVLALGPCTPAEVLAVVGRYIPAAQAAVAGQSVVRREARRGRGEVVAATAELLVLGKKDLVRENLNRAVKAGRIRRLARGVYAPPEVKLYQPDAG